MDSTQPKFLLSKLARNQIKDNNIFMRPVQFWIVVIGFWIADLGSESK